MIAALVPEAPDLNDKLGEFAQSIGLPKAVLIVVLTLLAVKSWWDLVRDLRDVSRGVAYAGRTSMAGLTRFGASRTSIDALKVVGVTGALAVLVALVVPPAWARIHRQEVPSPFTLVAQQALAEEERATNLSVVGGRVAVLNNGSGGGYGRVSLLDGNLAAWTAKMPLGRYAFPQGMVAGSAGPLYVGTDDTYSEKPFRGVAVLDGKTLRVIARVPTEYKPEVVAVTPNGSHAFVFGNADGTAMTVIDARGRRSTQPLGRLVPGMGPYDHAFVVSSDGKSLLFSRARTVGSLTLAGGHVGRLRAKFTVPGVGRITRIWPARNSRYVYAATDNPVSFVQIDLKTHKTSVLANDYVPVSVVDSPDGRFTFVTDDRRVLALQRDGMKWREVRYAAYDGFPIAVSPNSRVLYLGDDLHPSVKAVSIPTDEQLKAYDAAVAARA